MASSGYPGGLSTQKISTLKGTAVSAATSTSGGVSYNGACVDPSNPSNCGSTCTACGSGQVCATDSSDPAGFSCQQCPSGQEVFNNQCVPTCPEGQTRDPSTGQCQQPPQQCPNGGQIGDYNNCGGCGNTCQALVNSVCQQQTNQCVACPGNYQANSQTNTCDCPTGLTECLNGDTPGSSLKCTDVSVSYYNCGACENYCGDSKYPGGAACYNGKCGCGPDEHEETSSSICIFRVM
jgi:proprotein convertase subtilisin/kexin type 5